ncbi:hypothetical protein FSP39_010796 [Pinctada imbricata]|uniref:CCHC-type domain-containing protein n=1 Tax=Pinctada imbricata TaxID=66713 RepID=A0AA88YX37_PINIB|nr:hypothetical protein FSP39_009270 [Pinctada imbricata]KAK3108568.1 hypothetical protein FSP39_010796 [Pinctada imbricata]
MATSLVSSEDPKIKINFAESLELRKLPSVGESTAKKIIEYRVKVGNITRDTIGDLRNVKVTGELLGMIDFAENPDLHVPMVASDTSMNTTTSSSSSDHDRSVDPNKSIDPTEDLINKISGLIIDKNEDHSASSAGTKVETQSDPLATQNTVPAVRTKVRTNQVNGQKFDGTKQGRTGPSTHNTQSVGQPNIQNTVQPVGQPNLQNTGQPNTQNTVQNNRQTGGQQIGQPLGQPTGNMHIGGQPLGQPTSNMHIGGQQIGQPLMQNQGQPFGQQLTPNQGQQLGQLHIQTQGQQLGQPYMQVPGQTHQNPVPNQPFPNPWQMFQYPNQPTMQNGMPGMFNPWTPYFGAPYNMPYGMLSPGQFWQPNPNLGYQGFSNPGNMNQGILTPVNFGNRNLGQQPGNLNLGQQPATMNLGPQLGNLNLGQQPGNMNLGQQGNMNVGNLGNNTNQVQGNQHGLPNNAGNQDPGVNRQRRNRRNAQQGNQGQQGLPLPGQGNQGQPAMQPNQQPGLQFNNNQGQGQGFQNQGQGNAGQGHGNQGQGNGNPGQGNQGNGNLAQGNQGNGNQVANRRILQRQQNEPIPKGLKYDGKEHWLGFKHKFLRYKNSRNWTDEEARDQLCYCLESKASEYFATLLDRNEDIDFNELMTKLQKRFGCIPLPDTAQEQLNNSKQRYDESIEDWADRVLQLAVRAFPDLPEEHMTTQAIKRICHGCTDKEAGQHVINQNLDSVERVIDRLKSYQFHHKSIFSGSKKEIREIYVADSSESSDSGSPPVKVRQAKYRRPDRDSKDRSQQESQVEDLKKEVSEIKDNMKTILRHLENLQTRSNTLLNRSPVRNQTRSRSPSPDAKCFHCGGKGHFARDCPLKKVTNKPAKQVSFPNLNGEGSGQKA